MCKERLKEVDIIEKVLIPGNAKELEYFHEVTATCTDEQKRAVAKRMVEEKLPEGWQFTKAQIERFAAQESPSKVNWYPTIELNNDGTPPTEAEQNQAKVNEFKERQFKAYRATGMNEAEASAMSGFKP